ncbi:hypothetical protein NKR23_g7156 [Pleurostoma richardsiae]|uniref:Uncharacterized protein n=1 Tax=Pleurostoma richardsiae TaxID=41990 RepID=A0AA38RTY5_9PEZI|nr:hypothetical protein NKR23_g7156 [Pleurostoma richardsiae]
MCFGSKAKAQPSALGPKQASVQSSLAGHRSYSGAIPEAAAADMEPDTQDTVPDTVETPAEGGTAPATAQVTAQVTAENAGAAVEEEEVVGGIAAVEGETAEGVVVTAADAEAL